MKCYQHSRHQSYCSHEPVLRKVIRKWALNKNDHRDFNWKLVPSTHGATCRKLNEAAKEKILCIMALRTDVRPSAPSKTRMNREIHMAKKERLSSPWHLEQCGAALMWLRTCWCWCTRACDIAALRPCVLWGNKRVISSIFYSIILCVPECCVEGGGADITE